MHLSLFQNRTDAGRRLAEKLAPYTHHPQTVVVGLPRGGVAVAAEVAGILHLPLEIILVRKIRAPENPELALGAIAEGPTPVRVLNEEVAHLTEPPPGYLPHEEGLQRKEIERRRQLYGRPPLNVQGLTVIVVDDGIATGSTMQAALRSLRGQGAKHLALAVPVAPVDVLETLRHEADEIICLLALQNLGSVGSYYRHFPQLTDTDVLTLLNPQAHTQQQGRMEK